MKTAIRDFNGPPAQLMVGTCLACGKASFASRRDAKRAARSMFPGVHHRAVRCGERWHLQRVWGEAK
ncbi:hypothetical protein [Streptomyces sp. G1]|uniref:hypothetical protein n=1 Tax=Streptomyces sp. G1 TaxID=361572 RepID=UPI00202E89D9|nr:hypothetical protein [Streptomyces sp. G1]MCM1977186.1 hypothetical protein [Streptomyces sp. G1]